MRLPGPLVQGFRVSCYVFLLLAIPAAIIVYFDIPIIEFACSVDQTDWPGYFDSLTSSFMGVLLAYVATSITFYALLRSNLDRKKDENPRIPVPLPGMMKEYGCCCGSTCGSSDCH